MKKFLRVIAVVLIGSFAVSSVVWAGVPVLGNLQRDQFEMKYRDSRNVDPDDDLYKKEPPEKKPPGAQKPPDRSPPAVYRPPDKKPPVVQKPPEQRPPEKKPPVAHRPPEKKPPVVQEPPEKKPPVVHRPPEKKPPVVQEPPEKKPPVAHRPPEKKPPVVHRPPEKKPPVVHRPPEKKPPVVHRPPEKKPPVVHRPPDYRRPPHSYPKYHWGRDWPRYRNWNRYFYNWDWFVGFGILTLGAYYVDNNYDRVVYVQFETERRDYFREVTRRYGRYNYRDRAVGFGGIGYRYYWIRQQEVVCVYVRDDGYTRTFIWNRRESEAQAYVLGYIDGDRMAEYNMYDDDMPSDVAKEYVRLVLWGQTEW